MKEKQFPDYHAYLRSLEMKAEIRAFEPMVMARVAQLTNKSNQFNLTTRRYTKDEIEQLWQQPDRLTLYGRLSDCFGDNGVVSVVIGRLEGDTCHIDLWLMSCRVLKREMETAMMDVLFIKCRDRGIRRVLGYYYPTAKNGMVRDFYAHQGFTKIREDADGSTLWEYVIPERPEARQDVIRIETDQA